MEKFYRQSLRWLIAVSLVGLAAPTVAAQSTPTQPDGICPAQLPEAIDAITHQPQFRRSRWGILVQTQDGAQTLYAQEADRYFIPASNAKLLTTAAALEHLGAQFQIRTSVYQLQSSSNEVVLRVVGRGDPSLSDTELMELAQQLRDRGITVIDRLIGDDSYFQGDGTNPTWEWEDIQAGYGAPVNSLMVNQNAIGLTLYPQVLGQPLQVVWDDPDTGAVWQIENQSTTVSTDAPEFLTVGRSLGQPILLVQGQLQIGSSPEPVAIAVAQPAHYFLQRFVYALSVQGIQVHQTAVLSSSTGISGTHSSGTEVASVQSAPLGELLIETNQYSNNLYAEALLRLLGTTQPDAQSSLEAGLNVLQATLTQLGVDPDSYALADGAGLSRHNLVSPEAIIQTLQAMARSNHAAPYRHSLSVAGNRGTLTYRFQDTPIPIDLQGKTGTLTGVTALSGYLKPYNYSPLTFSILVNHFTPSADSVQPTIDSIVEILAQLRPC